MAKGNYKHGYYGTHTYKCWSEMVYRCKKSGKKYWFEKGIVVCDRWKKFKNFLEDMGEGAKNLSIDRIDNSKGYCKENCRWATSTQQARNRGNNKILNGKTLSEWSEILGVKRSTLAQRYYVYGWSVDKVLSTKLN